ncbi:aldo/keto reductase [Pseudoscardovia suis]|uniref:2,5-diketo-D-gluconic acid reductase n=1 Tax=Pseudoscardovia suis TaxID=987063 RepID=A0A261ERK6_9BIFI|nr:aldo/keto reductase [Pseudoscardovia suis]OZG49497.1 2,5-diketo-D-gluconic acid reductase [Pseudoscardovia suis]PJJ69617.1 diketogulonate reductase-like aldo/keto reductase [Pseudoscardovia suis]
MADSALTQTFTLNNGVTIPKLALGTWLIEGQQATDAVKAALAIGYRHIDTAEAYGNEAEVGRGVRESGVDRAEVFVTTKLAAECKDYDSAAAAIEESLRKLDLGYIDMMIIHSPQPWSAVNKSSDRYEKGNVEAYRALEDAYKAGKIRAIGVSNFTAHDIDNILANCTVTPAVNQVLAHITNTPWDVIDYCKKQGILVEAYSPIAHGVVLDNPQIASMAQRYGVSPAQLCIRYDLQLGLLPLPKTANPDHMRTNAQVDFEISDEDMEALKGMEHIKDYGDQSFWPVYGGRA